MKKWTLALALLLSTQALAKGKIQNEDIKSLSELVGAGGTMSQLPNDTKIYVTANGINTQLSTAIQSGVIGGGSGGSGGFNVLKNPGFEVGVTNWSATGGTLTAVNAGPNLLLGQGSATYQASAGAQSMISASVAVPNGLKGTPCAVGMMYKGGDANLKLQAWDGTNVLATVTLSNQANPIMQFATFQCPSSGNIQARIVSTASSALIAVDQMFLGQNQITQVSQASYYGGVYVPAGCYAANSNNSVFTDLAVPGAVCAGYTLVGNASSFASTGNMGVTFSNLPPGEYIATWSGTCNRSLNNSDVQYFVSTDGTTNGPSNTFAMAPSYSSSTGCTLTGHYTYTTAGTRTFKVQAFSAGGSTDNLFINNNGASEFFSLLRFPSQPETLVNANTINWTVEGQISGVQMGLGITPAGLGQFVQDPSNTLNMTSYGSIPALKPCVGVGISPAPGTGGCAGSGAPVAGVAFTPPAAGKVEVCAEWNLATQAGAGATSFYDSAYFVETAANDDSNIIATGVNVSTFSSVTLSSSELSGGRQHICEIFNIANTNPVAFRIYNNAVVAGVNGTRNEMQTQSTTGSGQSTAYITVRPVTQTVPAPVFLSAPGFSVHNASTFSSPGSGVFNLWTVDFDTSSSFSVPDQWWVVPVTGTYIVGGSAQMNDGFTYTNPSVSLNVTISGTGQASCINSTSLNHGTSCNATRVVQLQVGDTIRMDGAWACSTDATCHWISSGTFLWAQLIN